MASPEISPDSAAVELFTREIFHRSKNSHRAQPLDCLCETV
jgi:hypothetical protein